MGLVNRVSVCVHIEVACELLEVNLIYLTAHIKPILYVFKPDQYLVPFKWESFVDQTVEGDVVQKSGWRPGLRWLHGLMRVEGEEVLWRRIQHGFLCSLGERRCCLKVNYLKPVSSCCLDSNTLIISLIQDFIHTFVVILKQSSVLDKLNVSLDKVG